MRLILFVLLSFVGTSLQRSTPSDESYVAAVVEYAPSTNGTVNLQNYIKHIKDAAAQNADVIVFPELTLLRGSSASVPIHGKLKQYPVPARNPELYDSNLVAISKAALTHGIYVVINIQETMDCKVRETARVEYCPQQKKYSFNTNVVFDRNGAIIDRYRKINLFGEYSRSPALRPELGVFKTDFGVTFGHFVCFDLMFQVPSVQVVQKHNITDVIFPTMWFSELPYLTAIQIQEAYAYSLDINFLAAGANNVRVGSAGSGIYSGKAGALASIMPGVPTSKLLVARVPKVPGAPVNGNPGPILDPTDSDALVFKQDLTIQAQDSRILVPGYQEFTLTDNEVFCHFKVRMTRRNGSKGPMFRAVVHDGVTSYARRDLGVASCAVVACETNDKSTCPYKYSIKDKSVTLNELQIEMFTYKMQYNATLSCDNVVYFPVTIQTNKFPLQTANFTMTDVKKGQDGGQDGGREKITLKLNKPQDGLLSFGIWGRVFTRDNGNNVVTDEEDEQAYVLLENDIFQESEKYQVV